MDQADVEDLDGERLITAVIGARIRGRRIDAGIAVDQLAAAIAISAETLQEYEVGSRPIIVERLIAIAYHLGVRPLVFLEGFEGHANPGDEGGHRAISEDLARRLLIAAQKEAVVQSE
ncbi:MAG: helix-turn-helix transcriptional regulator [Rhodospirillales bacterium]|nr:helix-turn-helix transcriptional regulator [Acetobacter sp.]